MKQDDNVSPLGSAATFSNDRFPLWTGQGQLKLQVERSFLIQHSMPILGVASFAAAGVFYCPQPATYPTKYLPKVELDNHVFVRN